MTLASPPQPRLPFFQRVERFCAALSIRDNFWHRAFSFVFLPAASKSGISMRWTDEGELRPRMPYRRVNKNWYGAMAGAALAGNAEIAGGLIINTHIGRDYTCVCKKLSYRFLRPCKGHAEYRMAAMTGMEEGVASGEAFNLNTTLHVYQTGRGPEKVVGKAEITFHLVPKNKVGASLLKLGGTRKGGH